MGSTQKTSSPKPLGVSTTIYEGRIIDLQIDEVECEGVMRRFEVVTHGGAAVIIPQLDAQHLVLVEQWRHAAGQRLWEIPAGLLNPGEPAVEGARRELREETGYRATSITPLWNLYSAPGFCTELLSFYLATGLIPGEREPDEGEESMIVRTFHLDELQAMVERGEVLDMKTVLAISWAQTQRL